MRLPGSARRATCSGARSTTRAFSRPGSTGASTRSGRLLEVATVEEALADPMAADTLPPRARWYGMQWEIYSPPASAGGLPAFGHRGATGTLGMAIPGRNAIVVFLTNSNETEVVEEVIDAALEMFGS